MWREGNRLPTCGEVVSSVRITEVRERGEESVLVELGGEFERHDPKYLRKTVDKEDRRRRAHTPAEGGLNLFETSSG